MDIPLNPIFNGNSDLFKTKPHLGALKVTKCCDEIDITILYNDTAMHSLPVILNAINNALYKSVYLFLNLYQFNKIDIYVHFRINVIFYNLQNVFERKIKRNFE